MSDKKNLTIHTGYTNAEPEAAGYNREKVEQLDNFFSEFIKQKRLQCASYLLSRNGQIFAHKSMGKLTYHEDSPDFMLDSIRMIASITKVFTSIAVMKLVEEGKLYLEKPVSSIIEEFNTNIHGGINIFHLLTHTSGVCPDPGYFSEPYARGWWETMEARKHTEEPINWIKAILSGPLSCKPGEGWNYSSSGFSILGEIITRISGIHCEEYIIENICKPLEMNDTFFDIPEEKHGRVCITEEWGEKSLKCKDDRKGRPPRTGGGLVSTLSDLNRLAQMFLNKGELSGKRIIGRKTVEAMTRNQLGSNVPAYHWGSNVRQMKMGLGMSLTVTDLMTPGTFGHEGTGRSNLYIDPEEAFSAIFFVPTTEQWIPETIINTKSIIWSGIL